MIANRRQFLSTAVAMSVCGPDLIASAHANPLLWWFLRTPLTRAIKQLSGRTLKKRFPPEKARKIASAISFVGFMAEPAAAAADSTDFVETFNAKTSAPEQAKTDSDPLKGFEIWDTRVPQSLFLQFPASEEYLNTTLRVSLTNLSNGKKQLFAESPLALLPGKGKVELEIPVGLVSIRGLYSFSADVPELANTVRIAGTPPVVLV